jgi:hypothetical protein
MRVGDIGVTIPGLVTDASDVLIDISGATTLQMYLFPPRGAQKTVTAVFTTDGTDGKAHYVTAAAGDINQEGVWAYMIHVVDGAADLVTEKGYFLAEAI